MRVSRTSESIADTGRSYAITFTSICLLLALSLVLALVFATAAQATTLETPEDPGDRSGPAPPPDATEPPPPRRGPPTGLNWRVRGGATYQFPTKLDGGGKFNTSRTVLDIGARYGFTKEFSAVASISYGYDPYDFSDSVTIDGVTPWKQLHALRISAPIFWTVGEKWQLLAVPIFRMQADSPDAWGDSMTGGGLAAFSYRINDRLRLGPGIGVIAEIDRRPTIFPMLLMDWKVTDDFTITTGQGLGATVGPGLQGIYAINKLWNLSFGFRFERTRFRLSSESGLPGGVGEDESFPVFATLRVGPPFAYLAVLMGAEFRGKLSIEDQNGALLGEARYKPSPFVGFAGQIFF